MPGQLADLPMLRMVLLADITSTGTRARLRDAPPLVALTTSKRRVDLSPAALPPALPLGRTTMSASHLLSWICVTGWPSAFRASNCRCVTMRL